MSKKIIGTVLVLAVILTGCLPAPAVTPQLNFAVLSEIQGKVEIKNPEQVDFLPATTKDSLQILGQLRTGEDGRVRVDLPSGSIIRVAPSSLFTLEANLMSAGSWQTRLKMMAGRIWISLLSGSIDVETPSGMASVRGSYVSIWVDPQTSDVWVSCLEGWCKAENSSGSTDLIAGEGAVLYAWDPAAATAPPPPMLRYLSQDDINEFLQNNPELEGVMDAIAATASALPPFPTNTGQAPLPTPTATPGEACFSLVSPEHATSLPETGPVTFSWTEKPGAYKYVLTFIKPGGSEVSFISFEKSYVQEMSGLPEAGVYQWKVTAYDANIQPLCTAGPNAFIKVAGTMPVASPTPKENPPGPTKTPYTDSCVTLLAPVDGSTLPAISKVIFSWTAYPGAAKYIVTFIQPNGVPVTFLATTNSLERYIESFEAGGTYKWNVTPKNANNQALCTSGKFTFTKPQTNIVEPTKEDTATPKPVVPSKTPKPNTPTTFMNASGPTGTVTSCSPLAFSVDAFDPEGISVVKVEYTIKDSVGTAVTSTYQVLSGSGSTWSGSLSITPLDMGYTVIWYFWAIDAQGVSTNSGTSSFSYSGTLCP